LDDIKIYFGDRVVVLTDKATNDTDSVHVFENKKSLARQLECFETSNDNRLIIIHSDLKELFRYVRDCFKYIKAAGGLVMLSDDRVLLIKRLGKWDLPKGKSEKGESLQETALREVVEECGLEKMPVITGELMNTLHTYREGGKNILKHTVWYVMFYNGDPTVHPQSSENIEYAVWFPKNLLRVPMLNTYQSIREVLSSIKC